ncbi:hypothetical protein L596_026327 [Steinernema carpocapsae]|uniref:Nuclear receptor domain-containing protein n=1 Tax=Steinernema carpocapsae TaxID=34508 RepID=A0A4U5M102_STECR|nr:hypothetical protein L596_026327 [Steinernema carpocapsae]
MAPRLKPERGACLACGKIAVLAKYWGGTVCAACAVFFHRSIQKSLVYRCLADKELCGVTSVKGTDTIQQMQISDDHRFPILAAMITAVRNADHYFTSTLVPGLVLGTSEAGDNYLTSPKTVDTLKAKNISYKMIIDFAPILTGLDLGIKNVVFENCGILFNAIFCAHTDMMVNKTEPNRFYRSPNMYHDLDQIKLLYHVASFAPIDVARHSDELLSLSRYVETEKLITISNSRELLCHFLYMRYTVQPLSAEVLKSEQDLAALLIIAVLFASKY